MVVKLYFLIIYQQFKLTYMSLEIFLGSSLVHDDKNLMWYMTLAYIKQSNTSDFVNNWCFACHMTIKFLFKFTILMEPEK